MRTPGHSRLVISDALDAGFPIHFSTRGGTLPPQDCVFDVYLKTIGVFKHILQQCISRKIASIREL